MHTSCVCHEREGIAEGRQATETANRDTETEAQTETHRHRGRDMQRQHRDNIETTVG